MQYKSAVHGHPIVNFCHRLKERARETLNGAALGCFAGGFRQCAQRKASSILMLHLVIEPQVSDSAC